MAKDVLLNVRSGDVSLKNSNGFTDYMDVVWGDVFPSDTETYMNIIVPTKKRGLLSFENGELLINVHCPYNPNCNTFIVRILFSTATGYKKWVGDDGDGEYPAYWRMGIDGSDVRVGASELPLMNVDGNYLVRLVSGESSDQCRAYLYSAYSLDFEVGEADKQSAQLLSLCAPGKYYRFPTAGVDVTRYINSIVANTDLGRKLQNEFDSDSKTISDATFDSVTGNLDVSFSGTSIESDGNLTPVEDLDLELFHLADDDYMKLLLDEIGDGYNTESAILSFEELDNIFGVYFFDDLDAKRTYDEIIYGRTLAQSGSYMNRGDHQIVTKKLKAGTFIQFRYNKGYDSYLRFVLKRGNEQIYKYHNQVGDWLQWNNDEFRVSAIVLVDCTIVYSINRVAYNNGYGVYVVEPTHENLKDLLVITTDLTTSKFIGYTTPNSNIVGVTIGNQSGQIYVEKKQNQDI